jgi:hypothetical protein
VFGPLYGAPALLLREATRRLVGHTRSGWPTMLLFAAALGVVEAGLVDQSMFNDSYRDIPYWAAMTLPTYIPSLGLSAYTAVTFVVGHAVWSFGAPIAVVETLAGPRARQRWLGRPGLACFAVLYALAVALVFADQSRTEQFIAPPAQLAGAATVAAALVAAGVLVAVRPRSARRRGPERARAPRGRIVAGCTGAALAVYTLAPSSWAGVAVAVTALTGLAWLVLRWSSGTAWGQGHRLAAAGAALAVYALVAFWVVPLGNVDPVHKYVHNVVLGLGVVVLLRLAHRRVRGTPEVMSRPPVKPDDRGTEMISRVRRA